MAYGVRIRKGLGSNDLEGLFMTFQDHDDRKILSFKTKKLAQEYLNKLYKGENWEVVKLTKIQSIL